MSDIRDPKVDKMMLGAALGNSHGPGPSETVTLGLPDGPVTMSTGQATAYLLAQIHTVALQQLGELVKLNANIEEVRERFAPRNLLHPRRSK